MGIVICPECGAKIIVDINKCKREFDLEKTVNDVMQEIASEQGEVECYA